MGYTVGISHQTHMADKYLSEPMPKEKRFPAEICVCTARTAFDDASPVNQFQTPFPLLRSSSRSPGCQVKCTKRLTAGRGLSILIASDRCILLISLLCMIYVTSNILLVARRSHADSQASGTERLSTLPNGYRFPVGIFHAPLPMYPHTWYGQPTKGSYAQSLGHPKCHTENEQVLCHTSSTSSRRAVS